MKIKKSKEMLKEKVKPDNSIYSQVNKKSDLHLKEMEEEDVPPLKRFRGTKWEYKGTDKKFGNESKGVVDFTEEPCENTKKNYNHKVNDLMSKLEQFSDVWNDFPSVKNPQLNIESYHSKNFKKGANYEEKFEKPNKKKIMNDIVSENKELWVSKNVPEKIEKNCKKFQNPDKHKKEEKQEIASKFNKVSKTNLKDSGNTEANVSDLKRKKAVQEHHQLYNDQKNIIKQALSYLDGKGRPNKKVVFDDDDDDKGTVSNIRNNKQLEEKAVGHQKLFEDDDSDVETGFKVNRQFQGKKGQKLLELQSKFASDSRFTLDTRFYESGSEEENPSELETSADKGLEEEKKRQLEILESIVQQPIKPLSEVKKKKSVFSEEAFLRFDPTREDHKKYILTTQDTKKPEDDNLKRKKNKKTKAEPGSTSTSETNKTIVTTEKFVAVKEDLKEVLKKDDEGEKFSLLKLFGPKETDKSSSSKEPSQAPKKLKYGTNNPFKYDSSESEAEEEASKSTGKEESKKAAESQVKASWGTNFFFTDNDPRLQEAFEFLKCPEGTSDKKEYAEKRKMLKDFIRHKYKNNKRKTKLFKKKLGGLKKKSFKKKKVKQT